MSFIVRTDNLAMDAILSRSILNTLEYKVTDREVIFDVGVGIPKEELCILVVSPGRSATIKSKDGIIFSVAYINHVEVSNENSN